MAAQRIRLKWEQSQCVRCGNTRIRGQICPVCGLLPKDHEFNRPLQLRQRAANAAIAILDEEPRDVTPLDVFTLTQSGFWTTTGDWLVRLLTVCGDVASSREGSEARLIKTVDEFMTLFSQIAALKPLRPYIRSHVAATSMMQHLKNMTRAYLGALSASTPLAAQKLATEAQSELDSATAEIPQLVADAELSDLENADSVRDMMAALARRAAAATTGGDFLNSFGYGNELASGIFGCPVTGNVGFRYLLVRPVVEGYMDRHRFASVMHEAFAMLSENPARLAELGKLPQFREDLARTRLNIFDATQQAWHTLRSATIPRQGVRAISELAAGFVEDGGQLICIALLVCKGIKTRPYERLRHDDATDLLRSTRAHPALFRLVHGLDPDLRNAVSHHSYSVGPDGALTIDLRGTGKSTIELNELVDGLFAAIESVLAVLLALEAALAVAGIAEEDDEQLSAALGIEPVDSAALAMEVVLGASTSGHEDGDEFVLIVREPYSGKLSPAVSAAVTQIPAVVKTVRVETRDSTNQTHIFSGPVSSHRAFASAAAGLDKEIKCMATHRAWRIDGHPVVTLAALRLWLSTKALEAIELGYPCALPILRQLRRFAIGEGDEKVGQLLTDAMRDLRLRSTGTNDVTSNYQTALADWGTATVTWDPP
jgi:hypothetical protein